MKVKFAAPAIILLAVTMINNAHGRAHANPGRDSEKLSRRNLVCVGLQRFGLNGPGCSAGSFGNAVDDGFEVAEAAIATQLTVRQMQLVCPVLCRNQVGSDACNCDLLRASSGSRASSFSPDMDDVCGVFCVESITLAGCECNVDAMRNRIHHSFPNMNRIDGEDAETGGGGNNVTEPVVETTTEPDWGHLCLTLCQIGEGGALCNCDKPPFF